VSPALRILRSGEKGEPGSDLRPISPVFLNQFLNACFFEDAVCEECASLANQGRQSLEEPRKNLRLPVHKRVSRYLCGETSHNRTSSPLRSKIAFWREVRRCSGCLLSLNSAATQQQSEKLVFLFASSFQDFTDGGSENQGVIEFQS